MPKPTTIHEEVREKYGKKPSERIYELHKAPSTFATKTIAGAKANQALALIYAIIDYLDEQAENK